MSTDMTNIQALAQLESPAKHRQTVLLKQATTEHFSIHVYDTIAVFGQKGSGKTFFVKHGLMPIIPRKVIYDGEKDFPLPGMSWQGKGKGDYKKWYMFHSLTTLAKFMRDNYGSQTFLEKIWKKKKTTKDILKEKINLIYRPQNNMSLSEFNNFCQLIYSYGNMFITVDEIHNYLPSRSPRLPYWVAQILRLGRHRNIGLIGISQRPADVNTAFKGLASKAFIFKLIFSHDVEYVVKWFGKPMEFVRHLNDYKFIYFDGNKLTLCDRLNIDEERVTFEEQPAGKEQSREKYPKKTEEEAIERVIEEIEEVHYYEE